MRRADNTGCGWAAVVLLGASCLGGCGGGGQAKPDGGDGGPITTDGTVAGMRAYDVTAVLRATSNGVPPPATSSFTLIVDPDAQIAIAGGKGRSAIVALTTTDGRTYQGGGGFTVGDDGEACSGVEDVRYDAFEVTLADRSVTGTAAGSATISCGDCSFFVPFAATLTGTPDDTAPTLHATGGSPASPFDPFTLVASEPLPASAAAHLVGDDGSRIDLVPQIVDGAVPVITAFSKPDVVLGAGQGYVVTFEDLVDFAGNADRTGPPLRVASFGAAAIAPEDGFESAAGGTDLGGALVMTGDPLPAIAGNASIYVGADLQTPRGVEPHERTASLRLVRQPQHTMVRFTYRVVGVMRQASFAGALRIGVQGGAPGEDLHPFVETGTSEVLTTIGVQTIYGGPVTTMMVALPADVTGEALLVIGPITPGCRPPTVPAGVLIDDLHLE